MPYSSRATASVRSAGDAVEHHSSRRHADQPVAIGAREVQRVDIAEHGQAEMPVDALQRIHDDVGVARIQRGDRLVGEQQVGFLHQGAADGDALLLAAGQVVGAAIGEAGNVELAERGEGDGTVFTRPGLQHGAPAGGVGQPAKQDVVQHVEAADQVELLEDHGAAPSPVAQAAAGEGGDVGALPGDFPPAGRGQAVDHAQQGGFAGAGPADNADELAGRDGEVYVVHRPSVTELLHQTVDYQHRHPSSLAAPRSLMAERATACVKVG